MQREGGDNIKEFQCGSAYLILEPVTGFFSGRENYEVVFLVKVFVLLLKSRFTSPTSFMYVSTIR